MKFIQRFSEAMLWHVMAEKHEHQGIPIRLDPYEDESCLPNVVAALDLIQDVDPRSHRLVSKLLKGGIATYISRQNVGWYDVRRKACSLSNDHASDGTVENIALTIIHETCHARLRHCGVGYDAPLRVWVERVCTRREIAFAKLLAQQGRSSSDLVDETRDRLEWPTEESLSNAAFRRDTRKDRLMVLRQLKGEIPTFFRRCLVLYVRRSSRRSRARD